MARPLGARPVDSLTLTQAAVPPRELSALICALTASLTRRSQNVSLSSVSSFTLSTLSRSQVRSPQRVSQRAEVIGPVGPMSVPHSGSEADPDERGRCAARTRPALPHRPGRGVR